MFLNEWLDEVYSNVLHKVKTEDVSQSNDFAAMNAELHALSCGIKVRSAPHLPAKFAGTLFF